MRKEILDFSPVSVAPKLCILKRNSPWKIQQVSYNRKSFLDKLQKLKSAKTPLKRKPVVYRDSLITDYFKTRKTHNEVTFELNSAKLWHFDGLEENSTME